MAFLAAAESDWASLGGWDRGRRDVALQHYSAFTPDLTCETKEETGKVTSFVERSWATAWSGTVLPFRKPSVYLVFSWMKCVFFMQCFTSVGESACLNPCNVGDMSSLHFTKAFLDSNRLEMT